MQGIAFNSHICCWLHVAYVSQQLVYEDKFFQIKVAYVQKGGKKKLG